MIEQSAEKVEKDRSRLIMVLSGVAVVVVIALIVLLATFRSREAGPEMVLKGSEQFDSYASFVAITVRERREGERLGVRYGRILCTVRNTGERTLIGLQLRGAAVGFNNEVMKEKIITVVPGQRAALAPNQAVNVDLNLEPIPDPSTIMDMTVELHALSLK